MQFSFSRIGCLILLLSIFSTVTSEPSNTSHELLQACKHDCQDPQRRLKKTDQCLSLGSAQDLDHCLRSIRAETKQCHQACETILGLLQHYAGNGTCFGTCLKKFMKTANSFESDHQETEWRLYRAFTSAVGCEAKCHTSYVEYRQRDKGNVHGCLKTCQEKEQLNKRVCDLARDWTLANTCKAFAHERRVSCDVVCRYQYP